MKSKTFIALVIIATGCIIVCLMDFPAGLLILIPGVIFPIYQIYKHMKRKL